MSNDNPSLLFYIYSYNIRSEITMAQFQPYVVQPYAIDVTQEESPARKFAEHSEFRISIDVLRYVVKTCQGDVCHAF